MPQPTPARGIAQLPRSFLTLGVWAGIVTGFGELASIGADLLRSEFVMRSQDALWMIPAFDGVLFGLLGILLVGVNRFLPIPWPVVAGIFSGAGVCLILLLYGSVHPVASLVIGAGIGAQVGRALQGRVPVAARLVQTTLPWLLASLVLLAAATLSWRAGREMWLVRTRRAAHPGAPNVLLLILDTVRADDLSLYGYALRTTPELERFAERGTVFDLAFSTASWTLPSHASIFTGRWPNELGVGWHHGLNSGWPVLGEVLRVRGYATAAFIANNSFVTSETGLARGFEHFDAFPVSAWTALEATAFGRRIYESDRDLIARGFRHVPLLRHIRLPRPEEHRSAAVISGTFLNWLDRTRPAPFFACLNFMDAHRPYTVPDSFKTRFRRPLLRPIAPEAWTGTPQLRLTPADVRPKRDAYDGSIAYLDAELGRLFRELQHRGLLENTLVVVTADHGEEFAEHGLVEHGNSVYRHSIHVPLLISFPGHVPLGRRVGTPASLRNLGATILDLIAPQGNRLPGRSLTRLWSTVEPRPDTIAASVTQSEKLPDWYPASRGDLNSISFDGWRYIRNEGDGFEELYDFDHDLLERWNLVDSDTGRRLVPRYRAALASLVSTADRAGTGSAQP